MWLDLILIFDLVPFYFIFFFISFSADRWRGTHLPVSGRHRWPFGASSNRGKRGGKIQVSTSVFFFVCLIDVHLALDVKQKRSVLFLGEQLKANTTKQIIRAVGEKINLLT